MNTAKETVQELLSTLPEDCSLEDIQYHLYVVEKIQRGMERAERDGTVSHEDAELRLQKWLV